MLLTLALVCLLVLAALKCFLILEWPNPRTFYYLSKIHGLRGWPLIGSLPAVMKLKEEEYIPFFIEMARKFPKISSYSIGGVAEVVLQEPDDIQKLLSSVDHISKGIEYIPVRSWFKNGLLTSDGQKWRSRRKLLTPAFHFRILEDSVTGMNRNARNMVEKLSTSKGKTVEIKDMSSTCTLNVIMEAAMGIDLKEQAQKGQDYTNNVKWLTRTLMHRIINASDFLEYPFRWLPRGRTFAKKLAQVQEFTEEVINERRRAFTSDNETTKRKKRLVFLDCLLDVERSNPGSLSEDGIREEVDTFMFEGHDTTSSALVFTLYNIARHQHVQEKLRQEMEEIFEASERDVSLADTNRMTYLDKVLKESLRMFPSVPGFTRRLQKDLVLDDGMVVPSGCNVLVFPIVLHRKPEFYPEPDKFDPERFSEDQVAGRHPFAYLPFSAGPRNCIGQKFAMMELKIILSHLIRNFQFTSNTEEQDIKLIPQLVLTTQTPIEFKFVKI